MSADPVVCTCPALASALAVSEPRVRRTLERLGRYRYSGSGNHLGLTRGDVVAVTVATAVAGTGRRRARQDRPVRPGTPSGPRRGGLA